MKPLLFLLSLGTLCSSKIVAAEPPKSLPVRESIEWCDIWISHADETKLPRVLLIGDSIARDYYPEVEKRLSNKAFVARLTTSRFVADQVLLKEIELVLDQARFDVIHFNNGMHGWQHSEAKYREAFPKLLKTIRSHAPKARLIWAATTPIRDAKAVIFDGRVEYSNERIAARNAIAAKIVTAQKIPINDLNFPMNGHPEYHSDHVHFNHQGTQILAAQVATEIEKFLPP